MKILISPARYFLEDKGGSANSKTVEFMIALANQSYKVYGVSAKAEIIKKLPPNLKIITLERGKKRSKNAILEMKNRLWFSLKSSIFSYYFAQKENIEVIHHFSRVPVTGPALPNLITLLPKKFRPKVIVGPIIQEQTPKTGGEISDFLAVKKDIYCLIGKQIYTSSFGFLTFLKKLFLKRADLVICVSKEVKKLASQYLSQNKLIVIPSGVDIKHFKQKRAKQNLSRKPIIISVCKLIKRKDVISLIRAFEKIKKNGVEAKVLIIGTGPEKENLKKVVEEKGLQQSVDFVGKIAYHQIPKYYQKADIFVNTTLHEPYSNTNLEAMASGLPVITTNGEGVNSNVSKECGIFISKKNPDNLAKALTKLIRNREIREKMGKSGRKRVEEKYSWEAIAKQFISIYQDISRE